MPDNPIWAIWPQICARLECTFVHQHDRNEHPSLEFCLPPSLISFDIRTRWKDRQLVGMHFPSLYRNMRLNPRDVNCLWPQMYMVCNRDVWKPEFHKLDKADLLPRYLMNFILHFIRLVWVTWFYRACDWVTTEQPLPLKYYMQSGEDCVILTASISVEVAALVERYSSQETQCSLRWLSPTWSRLCGGIHCSMRWISAWPAFPRILCTIPPFPIVCSPIPTRRPRIGLAEVDKGTYMATRQTLKRDMSYILLAQTCSM